MKSRLVLFLVGLILLGSLATGCKSPTGPDPGPKKYYETM